MKETIQNTLNTSTHINKTPTQLSKHPYTLQNSHIHTLQNKLKRIQYKIHPK